MPISIKHLLRSALLLLQATVALGCAKPPHPAQLVPGTSVSLAPPSGFSPASTFTGFMSEDGRASILVAELPAHASEAVATLFVDEQTARRQFATRGVRVKHLESLDVEGRAVPVAIGTQNAHGQTFNKWIALFPGSPTVMITVQAPTNHAMKHKSAMMTLTSVKVSPPASLEEQLAALPFTVTPEPPFRIVDTLAGASAILTAGELDTDPEGRQPLLIVASQLSLPFGSDDLADVSDQLIAGTREMQHGTVVSRHDVMFAGIAGHRVSGHMPDGGTFHHYLALWPGQRFVRLAAILPAGSSHDVQDAVTAVAASIRFRE
ncbi:hypothetical protein G9274_002207 [Stenotrophomonas rhizophila]|nr:hypothetical protein G9274_002207 [Stenotrophomonas rhizophila]